MAQQVFTSAILLLTSAFGLYEPPTAHENDHLTSRPSPARPSSLEGPSRRPGCQSHRSHHAHDGRLDADPGSHHAFDHATPTDHPAILADRRPPHDRTVRILLRNFTLPDLHLARQVLRHPRDVERHRQAPIHYRRLLRLRPLDSPGPNLDRMVNPPPRRQELAAPAPPDLFHRNPGGGTLHLAGEGRSPQAHRIRRRAQHPVALP